MKVSIIVFPGTNCEEDTQDAFTSLGCDVTCIWHEETHKLNGDLVVIPGGFSYGDMLRSGAIAKLSPIIKELKAYASKGGMVLGICNGFQLLTEINLLEGSFIRNKNMKFISKNQPIKVIDNNNKLLSHLNKDDILNIPIAHMEGNYYASDETIEKMYQNEQILLKYCNTDGDIINVNGSAHSIAGICNSNKNVFALMSHPERAINEITGLTDGIKLLKGLIAQ